MSDSSITIETARAGRLVALFVAAAVLLLTTLAPPQALADFGVDGNGSFDGQLLDQDGSATTQAGAHPHTFATTIEFNSSPDPVFGFFPGPDDNVKTIDVDLPPGLIGNPTSMPRCTSAALTANNCPPSTVVGQIEIDHTFTEEPAFLPLTNLVPPAGVPARFGFKSSSIGLVVMDASVRSDGDYGLSVTSRNTTQAVGILFLEPTFWGVPADPSHDERRCARPQFTTGLCTGPVGNPETGPVASGVPEKPFLSLPTSCSGAPLDTKLSIDSWQNPGVFEEASFFTHHPGDPNDTYSLSGCENLAFDPSLTIEPTSHQADSPTGLEAVLTVPQDDNPNGLATAHVKRVEVTLPEGTTVSPASADGLGACSADQIGLVDTSPIRFNLEEPTCPDQSKVGSATIDTPLLDDPMQGELFLARQDDNPFDTLLSGYLVARGPGLLFKLPGRFDPDPQTGEIVATFDNNPELPFSKLTLRFKGGARAPVATPQACGIYTVESRISPWSAADPENPTPDEIVTSTDQFVIDQGPGGGPCLAGDPSQPADPADLAARPFAPSFSAGTVHPLAGASSPFVLRATRADGHQELKRIQADLPPGLLAKLAGVAQCPEAALAAIPTAPGTGAAEAASPSCPAASRVGTARVGAGAGSSPFYIAGSAYLAGPYGGAPLSLAIVTPALAGPYDLGNVVVRSKLTIDPDDAQVHVESDEIPHILQGIPLRIRDIRVLMDRPGFIQNPTNCDPLQVTGQLTGAGGDLASAADDVIAPVSQHFQLGGCGGLGFSPTMTATILNGQDGIHRSDHPELLFDLQARPGDANLRTADVSLPAAFQIDQANLGNLCSETELAATECAGRNTIGHATAITPLLDQPLSGPVYAVSGSGGLPRLAVILHGPPELPIELVLRSDTTTNGNRIRNVFPLVPDAAISRFALTISGGPAGYLVNNENVCAGAKKAKGKKSKTAKKKRRRLARTRLIADALYTAQNNMTKAEKIRVAAPCGKKKKKKKQRKRRRHR